MSCHYQYCMSDAMNNVLSNGNHTNDNNTTTRASSLLATAGGGAYPWIQRVYSN